jgi:aldehyde dehydrogenase (NAD+)/glyceraldehyde-3-phosphate dehydrogenase (NADP+)
MATLSVRNPYDGTLLHETSFASESEISKTLESSQRAFHYWKNSSAWERSQLLLEAAKRLENQKEDFASLICQEAGKPIHLARIEVSRALGVLQWAAGEAQRFSGELIRTDASSSGRMGFGIHTRFPRGVILGITPFNFPLNLAMHKVAPAVACGCSILIKPSPYTPLTALRLQELFSSVPGLVQVVLADDNATASLTRSPEVAYISFTGSAKVGWQIRRQAPEKPTTLELGGNAWVIIMEDTPVDLIPQIAKRISGAAFGYAGQSCISVQNVAAANSIWGEFEKHLTNFTELTPYGDPKLETVTSGPLIHTGATDRVRKQLSQLPAKAEVVSSRSLTPGQAQSQNLVSPTLIVLPSESDSLSPIVQEEIFAPVMTVRKFNDLPALIQKINSSRYGLQAGVFTQHWPTIEKLYQELQVGGLVVNDVPTTRYDHQPYGGVKDSGQGREGVRYAMEEMTESKFLSLSSTIPL